MCSASCQAWEDWHTQIKSNVTFKNTGNLFVNIKEINYKNMTNKLKQFNLPYQGKIKCF